MNKLIWDIVGIKAQLSCIEVTTTIKAEKAIMYLEGFCIFKYSINIVNIIQYLLEILLERY